MLLLLFDEVLKNAFVIFIGCHQEGIIIGHPDEGELANGVVFRQSLGVVQILRYSLKIEQLMLNNLHLPHPQLYLFCSLIQGC